MLSHTDNLIGYSLDSIILGNHTYPIILESSKESKVNGEVIEVTNEDLRNLDRYETDAYRRITVTLKSGISAWVYCR